MRFNISVWLGLQADCGNSTSNTAKNARKIRRSANKSFSDSRLKNSFLEVAMDPSYTIFFLEAWQKRPVLALVYALRCCWLHICSASSSGLAGRGSICFAGTSPPLFKALKWCVEVGVNGERPPWKGAQDMFDPLWLKIFGSCLGIAG